MPISTAGRNAALGGLAVTHASLHSGHPGDSGANEISGGGYARVAVTFAAASGGVRAQTGSADFTVPAGATVQHVGFWTALTGGTFLGFQPLGSQPAREFVAELAGDLIRSPAHGLANGQQIVFVGGTPPGGLVAGTVYFVVGAATDTLQVAATSGGAAIDLTTQAASDCQLVRIIPEIFGSAGTLTISSASLALNF